MAGLARRPRTPWLALDTRRCLALGAYGFIATLQPDPHFGRILAVYGGIFVAGSLLWGVVVDGYHPDRYDIIGALICLTGVAVIMYASRSHSPQYTTLPTARHDS